MSCVYLPHTSTNTRFYICHRSQKTHWSSKIVTNLPNPIVHLVISSLKITIKKISGHQIQQSSNLVLPLTFFLHTYTQAYSTPLLYKYTNTITLVYILDRVSPSPLHPPKYQDHFGKFKSQYLVQHCLRLVRTSVGQSFHFVKDLHEF
jgi:hypothetical protein